MCSLPSFAKIHFSDPSKRECYEELQKIWWNEEYFDLSKTSQAVSANSVEDSAVQTKQSKVANLGNQTNTDGTDLFPNSKCEVNCHYSDEEGKSEKDECSINVCLDLIIKDIPQKKNKLNTSLSSSGSVHKDEIIFKKPFPQKMELKQKHNSQKKVTKK